MSLDKVAEVFDTTEVSKVEGDDEDEDVEALMEALYGEAENTKDWCKYQGGDVEEEQPAPVEEDGLEEEEEYVEAPLDYADDQSLLGGAPMEQVELRQASPQGGNFLGFLEESAAGKHENFAVPDAPTRPLGWTDELRKTAEVAAANVDAVTNNGLSALSGSKKVDGNIQSASRLLAYAVMLASVITLCAKASVTKEEVAESTAAMAAASRSLSDLKPIDDTNKLDPTGEFTAIDEDTRLPKSEEEDKRAEEKKRKEIAEKMHKKHMDELKKKQMSDDDEKQEKKEMEREDAEKREAQRQEQEDIKKVLDVAKSLERREKEEGGAVDKETAEILEAAKSLAAKELQKQKHLKQQEKDLDHQVQDDHDNRLQAAEKAKRDALKLLKENTMDGGGAGVDNLVEKAIDTQQQEENAKARKKEEMKQEEAHKKAAEEEEQRLQQKAEIAKQLAAEEAQKKKKLELAREELLKYEWQDQQEGLIKGARPDTNKQCGLWAAKGECQANAAWMLENCAKSCAVAALRDKDPRCSGWADDGECENNQIYMKHHCPASCKARNAPAPAPPETDEGYGRAKRAAGLKRKLKNQQVQDKSKPFIVRGKGLAKAAERVLDETDSLNWRGRGAAGHTRYKSAEDDLLNKLSSIPEAN